MIFKKKLWIIGFLLFSQHLFGQNIEHLKIQSDILGEEREIMVYTPRLYEESPNRKYEVVYVFDAQARQYFDFVHSSLTFLNPSVPMIVVGIISENRDVDFLPKYNLPETAKFLRGETPKADRFIEYINTEVIQYIEKNYRTLPTRIAVGHSNGGVFITYCLIEKPEIFDVYLSISPHLRYDGMQMIKRLKEFDPTSIKEEKFYYMCKGNESGVNWPESINAAKELFLTRDYQKNIHFIYNDFENETHGSVFAPAVLRGFKEYFKYQFYDVDKMIQYYEDLSDNYDYHINENIIVELAFERSWFNQIEDGIKILNWGLGKYPDSEAIKNYIEMFKSKL